MDKASESEEKNIGEIKEINDGDKWVLDSSVDYKGRVPLRASTGAWKASMFIITIEFSERLSFFGLAANLIQYLTKVMHQDLDTAAETTNLWSGVSLLMPLIGGFLADAYTGRYILVLISSLIYLAGLSLLTLSQFIPSFKPCRNSFCTRPAKAHEVVFFCALYLISIGTGGYKPCLESFGGDQFDDNHPKERIKKMSYFSLWNLSLAAGLFLGVTVIVYLMDNVGWGAANLVLSIVMAITIAAFYVGGRYYRYRAPEGSLFTPIFQVVVSAIRKRNLPYPSSPALLYEVSKSENPQGRLLNHTNRLRFLDKAAIIEERSVNSAGIIHDPWRLATVTKVEEVKLVLGMIPIWLTTLMFGVSYAQTQTFFVKQAASMNRRIGPHFEIPPASAMALNATGMLSSIILYEKLLAPMLRKARGRERGISILQRVGIGMVFVVSAFLIAALVETKRIKTAKHGVLSMFWLTPQLFMHGFGDGFSLIGLQEYFYDQVPDSMRSLGMALYLSIIGGGGLLSNLLIIIINSVTKSGNGKGWIGKDVKSSRLDKFYWFIGALNGLNFCCFMIVASKYTYKNVQREVAPENKQRGGSEAMA